MKTNTIFLLPALAFLFTGCMKSNTDVVKSAIAAGGYKMTPTPCALAAADIKGYKEGECYMLDTPMRAEFYTLAESKDAINAVAGNVTPQKDYYFRQIAAGKIWFMLKGDWSQRAAIDSLMDRVSVSLSPL